MRRARVNVVGAAVVLALVGPALMWPAADALTTVKRMTFPEVVNSAQIITLVEVIDIEHSTGDDGSLPYDRVHFTVYEILKQEADWNGSLRFPGGANAEGQTLTIAGMPRLKMGDRAVLFVREGGLCPLVGWWQGLYRMHDHDGFLLVTDHGGRAVTGFRGSERGPLPLLGPEQADLREAAIEYGAFAEKIREAISLAH